MNEEIHRSIQKETMRTKANSIHTQAASERKKKQQLTKIFNEIKRKQLPRDDC